MKEEPYYLKISEMAEMFQITTKSLRLYEKMGLFSPAFINGENGYRFYTIDQANRLNTILSLKSVGFSLLEIKEMFERKLDARECEHLFQKKRAAVQKELDSLQFTIEALDGMIQSTNQEAKNHLTMDEEASVLGKVACLDNIRFSYELTNIFWL